MRMPSAMLSMPKMHQQPTDAEHTASDTEHSAGDTAHLTGDTVHSIEYLTGDTAHSASDSACLATAGDTVHSAGDKECPATVHIAGDSVCATPMSVEDLQHASDEGVHHTDVHMKSIGVDMPEEVTSDTIEPVLEMTEASASQTM